MKRDMDLVRTLILHIEQNAPGESTEIEIEGVDEDTINYHLSLMGEAELLRVQMIRECVIINGITWKGHEFADLVRDKAVWTSTLAKIGKKTASTSFEILVHVLKGTVATLLS